MYSKIDPDYSANFEFGVTARRSRVDPAKTLDLIMRIQAASGREKPSVATSKPRPQPIARIG